MYIYIYNVTIYMEILEYPQKLKMAGHVLVKASSETVDLIDTGKILLFKDSSYDNYKSKNIRGEVTALPFALPNIRMHQVDRDFPKSTRGFGGDIIERQVNAYEAQIRRKLQIKELGVFMSRYRSGSYEPEYTVLNDQPIHGKQGDTVYFHYLALNDINYVGQDLDYNRYYKVPYETVFCFVSGQGTQMVNGYLQVDPYWDEGYEEIDVDGVKVRGKLKGNLVVGFKDAPEYLTGIIHKKGYCFGKDNRSTLKEGDVILYEKGSEFKNTIEGKEVMLMQQWQVIAKKEGNTFIPVGDYVHLKTNRIPERKIILVDQHYRQDYDEVDSVVSIKKDLEYLVTPVGKIISTGENCKYLNGRASEVYFNTKARVFNLEDTIFIREGDIMAEWEGDYKIPSALWLK